MCKNVAIVPMKKTVDSGEFIMNFHLDFLTIIV